MTTTRSAPVRIMILGEHPIFREGLRRLLERESSFLIVCEPVNGMTAVDAVRESAADILLLGLTGAGQAALDILRDLAESASPVRTIVLSDAVGTTKVSRAVQLGARGVVLKDSAPDMLFQSIESVLAGHVWIGREQVAEAPSALRKLEAARRSAKAFGLTPRELEIVRAVVAGSTNKEIAEQSGISENTVKTHLTHIFNKLGASNRVELALFAAHHRLLDGI
jgi:DNA-binding NarL/FixJ family response regulator